MIAKTFRPGDGPLGAAERATTVVGIDGSEASLDAVRWATLDAELHHSDLSLVSSVGNPIDNTDGGILPASYYDDLYADTARALAEARAVAERTASRGTSMSISTEFIELGPISSLLDLSSSARMLVLGSRGLGALGRGLLGSVSSSVSMHAHCPVTVVRSYTETTVRSSATKPVVVGVDGSAHNAGAVDAAFEEASLRNTALTVVHAWSDDDLSVGPPGRSAAWKNGRASAEALMNDALATPIEKYPNVRVRRVIVRDRPATALLDHGQAGQLLVVGSHGRGGFTGMLLGSTGRSVLHAALCPVMVFREPHGQDPHIVRSTESSHA